MPPLCPGAGGAGGRARMLAASYPEQVVGDEPGATIEVEVPGDAL
jgi:hypothetical protein